MAKRATIILPHLEVEFELFREGFTRVAAIDEVGRGSVFGPCCVGLVVIDSRVGPFPEGLRDSKLLAEKSRVELKEPIEHWAVDVAVGESSAREIDDYGLTAALRLAGRRALAQIVATPDVILLDGSFDWLSAAPALLLDAPYPDVGVPEVRTRIKADLTCASVAAASVLAKVHRDGLVTQLARDFPGYEIERNKGYATSAHLAALRLLGPSELHRISWKLPPRALG